MVAEYNYEQFVFTLRSGLGNLSSMIVCVCKRVNSAQVRNAVRDGANCVEELSLSLGLGTGCGRCVEFAEQLIDEECRSVAYAVNAYEVEVA